jgi:hypothetical protein
MSKSRGKGKSKSTAANDGAAAADAAADKGKGELHKTMEDALAQFGGLLLTGPRFKEVVETATATAKALGAK